MALSLRERLIGGFSGAVMAVSAALPSTMASGTAQATDLSCPAEVSVPCVNLTHRDARFVRTYAARASGDQRVALIYFGSNLEARTTAETVVQFFNEHGVTTGLILANGAETYQVYIDAQQITNEFPAGIDARQLGEQLNAALVRYREVAAVPGTDAAPGG